jgi:hypothetical protein
MVASFYIFTTAIVDHIVTIIAPDNFVTFVFRLVALMTSSRVIVFTVDLSSIQKG